MITLALPSTSTSFSWTALPNFEVTISDILLNLLVITCNNLEALDSTQLREGLGEHDPRLFTSIKLTD